MKKRILLISLALLVAISLVAVGCAKPAPTPTPTPTPQGQFKFTFSSAYAPPPQRHAVMFELFMEEVTKRSGGQITFETFYGGAMGTVVEQLALVRDGTVDMVEIPLGANPTEMPINSVFEGGALFGPKDPMVYSKIERMYLDAFPEIDRQNMDNNVKTVYIFPWGPLELMSTSPIQSLADLKGKKVMIWGYWYPKAFESICGVMSTPAYERYMNMKLGVGDVDVMPDGAFYDNKMYEVAPYHTAIPLSGKCNGRVFINLDSWNELTPEIQEIIMEVGKEMETVHAEYLVKYEAMCRKYFEDSGVVLYEMSEADAKAWVGLLPDIGAEWAEKAEAAGYPGWELVQFVQDAAEDMGFEWPRRWAVR